MKRALFSDDSIDLVEWISSANTSRCIPSPKWPEKTTRVFTDLFNDIVSATKYVDKMKREEGQRFYNVKVHSISRKTPVPRPSTFNIKSIPEKIRNHIERENAGIVEYRTQLYGKKLKVLFVVYEVDPLSNIDVFSKYFDRIVTWMYIANKYASDKCGRDLTVFIYMTPFKKFLPDNPIKIIGQEHANTAFTYSCPAKNSEIVIFRQEEWFKVLIHETFHLLSLDFSCMNAESLCKQLVNKVFPISSDFRLYEAYTEAWAVTIHTSLCTYLCFSDTQKLNGFLQTVKFLMGFESMFKVFQMHKILGFMGLDYSLLYSGTKYSQLARETLYKEDTNVFAYHVATTILMCNYPLFLEWCQSNNRSPMLFNKTQLNIESFCKFLIIKHNSAYTLRIINNITAANGCYSKMLKNAESADNVSYIADTMRMSVCDMV